MTQPPQPTEPFAQHPRLAELVTALGFRRYPLFLTGLLDEERAVRCAGRPPSPAATATWWPTTPARCSSTPGASRPRVAITHSEVLGVVPLEVTDTLLDEFRRLADRHQRGFMVEHVMELLATR